VSPFVRLPLAAVIILVAVLLAQGFLLYGLLKIHSRVMNRMGPMYAGRFHGVGQPIAEFLKPIQKEDIVPASADRVVFQLAPLVALVPALLVFAVIPVAPGVVAADLELGVVFALAVAAMAAISIVMASYGAQSKFTLVGGLRAVGQIIAYELPIILGALAAVMLAGSLNLTEIVEAQESLPFVLNPFGAIAFGMFIIAAFAEAMWNPFDIPIAESELITGPFTEYSGMRFILFFMSEFTHVIALSALATVLFFGGWHGPILPPIAWFVIKLFAFGIFFIWVRFSFPRLREDQLMKFAWKILIPLGLLNVLAISVYRVLT
jgi:NADH-quinone oxidoreductase subunit H